MKYIIGTPMGYVSGKYLETLFKSIYKKDTKYEKLKTKSYKKYEKSFFRGKK